MSDPAERRPVRGSLLISHPHWDHIQGLPFFAPLFVPGNEWGIYAPRGQALDVFAAAEGETVTVTPRSPTTRW